MTLAAMALGRAGQDVYRVYKKKTWHSTLVGVQNMNDHMRSPKHCTWLN